MASRLALPASYGFQPQQPPLITKGSLGQGIIEAVTLINGKWLSVQPNARQPQSAALFTNPATSPTLDATRHGLAMKYVAGSSTGQKRDTVPYQMLTASGLVKECSMMCIVGPRAVSDASIAFASYGHSSLGGLFFLQQGATAGNVSFWCRDDAGTSQNTNGVPPAGVWANDAPSTVLIGTRSQAQNFHRTYAGASLSVNTTATSLGNATFNRTAMGCLYYNGGTGFQFGGKVALMVAWSRALTHAECIALSANPWLVFDAPARQLFLDQAVGGFDRSAAAAVTLGGVTRTAAGILLLKAAQSATLASVTRIATGTLTIKASASQALAAITRVATGALTVKGTVSATLGAVVQVGTGKLIIKASSSPTLAAILQSAAGTGAYDRNALAVQTLTGLTRLATGKLIITGQQ